MIIILEQFNVVTIAYYQAIFEILGGKYND